MSNKSKIGKLNTKVIEKNDYISVDLYNTQIFQCYKPDRLIHLNHGRWPTSTTKSRMNQIAKEYHLPYHVFSKQGEFFVNVTIAGQTQTLPFDGNGSVDITF